MTTLWMSPKKRVENESQRTGHDLIPSENAVRLGIPRRNLKAHFNGSLAFARDDQVSQASL